MRKCWQFLRERGAVKAITGIVALLRACAVAAGLVLLLAVGPTKPKQAALPKDDSDTIYPLDALNPTSPTFNSSACPGELYYDLRNSCVLVGCGGGALNGIINVMDFGARGDAEIGTDGTVSSSYNFTSASLNCTTARLGETIHVIAAGSGAGLLTTTIASCSGNTFVMTAPAQETISGTARWVIGHDDTAAIQTGFNTSYVSGFSTNAVYFPSGRYLVTSPLNFTGVSNDHVYGAGADVSIIQCSSSGNSVCLDDSAGNNDAYDHLTVNNGVAAQDASTVNFLAARTVTNANKIGDTFHNVNFRSFSPWNFFGYQNEQTTWGDVYWEADGPNTVNLTISQMNTPVVTSPFVTFAAAGGSTTAFTIDGAETSLTTNGAPANVPNIYLDGSLVHSMEGINIYGAYIADGIGMPRSSGMTMIGDEGNGVVLYGLRLFGVHGNMSSANETLINLAASRVDRADIVGINDPAGTSSAWQMQFNSLTNSHMDFQGFEGNALQANYCAGTSIPGTAGLQNVNCPYAFYVAARVSSNLNFEPAMANLQVDGIYTYGGISMHGIPDPPAPTVTVVGTPGSATCTYYVEYGDIAFGRTDPSPPTTITNCPNTLSATNYVSILPALTGAERAVYVLKGSTSATIGFFQPADSQDNPTGAFYDTGQSTSPFTPASVNNTGQLVLDTAANGGIRCAGTVALTTGSATVRNACISGARPVLCTDDSATGAEAVSCVPKAGSLSITGNSSDTIAWAQF